MKGWFLRVQPIGKPRLLGYPVSMLIARCSRPGVVLTQVMRGIPPQRWLDDQGWEGVRKACPTRGVHSKRSLYIFNMDIHKGYCTTGTHKKSIFSMVRFLSTSGRSLAPGPPTRLPSLWFSRAGRRDCRVSYRSPGKLSKPCHRQDVLASKLAACPVLTLPVHLFSIAPAPGHPTMRMKDRHCLPVDARFIPCPSPAPNLLDRAWM